MKHSIGSVFDKHEEPKMYIPKNKAREYWALFQRSQSGNYEDIVAFNDFVAKMIPPDDSTGINQDFSVW